MPKDKHSIRMYAKVDLETGKKKCGFCGKDLTGAPDRLRSHLAGGGGSMRGCPMVYNNVKKFYKRKQDEHQKQVAMKELRPNDIPPNPVQVDMTTDVPEDNEGDQACVPEVPEWYEEVREACETVTPTCVDETTPVANTSA